jgi:tripartite-type tricarboxylate transporter receptor subunit TctC
MMRISWLLRSLRMVAATLPLVALVAAQAVEAQTYPNRPVRIVVPAAAGGALDVISRILAIKVGEIWNQQLYVENKPGANWIIGMDAVAKSAPDGYTLLFVASSGLTINPYVFNMPIDPLRDLTLVATATNTPFVLLANNDLPARNLPEFLAHLKANPGKLNHASNSATTILNSELLKARANVDYVDINYRGASQAIIATQGGSTQFCFVDLGSGSPAIQGKTLRALGLTSPKRYELAPDIPTIAEQGLPGYATASTTLLLAPANTPKDIVEKISSAFQHARQLPDVQQKLNGIGQAVSTDSMDEATAALGAEAQQWKQLIAERGIKFGN